MNLVFVSLTCLFVLARFSIRLPFNLVVQITAIFDCLFSCHTHFWPMIIYRCQLCSSNKGWNIVFVTKLVILNERSIIIITCHEAFLAFTAIVKPRSHRSSSFVEIDLCFLVGSGKGCQIFRSFRSLSSRLLVSFNTPILIKLSVNMWRFSWIHKGISHGGRISRVPILRLQNLHLMGLDIMVTMLIISETVLVNSVETLCWQLVEHARSKATLLLHFLPRSNLFATKRGYLLQMLALFGRKLIYLSRFAKFLGRNSMLLRFAPTVRSRLNLRLAQILLILLFELI